MCNFRDKNWLQLILETIKDSRGQKIWCIYIYIVYIF